MPRDILLIGSLPLTSVDDVFAAVGKKLGDALKRVPDGEGGHRRDWLHWQSSNFAHIPFIEPVGRTESGPAGLIQYRMKPGFPAQAVKFEPLGYAAAAAGSYKLLVEARKAGRIAETCRFQMGVATPISVVAQHVDADFQAAIEPAYEARLLVEIGEIAAIVPPDDLTVQLNLAAELSIFEGHRNVHFEKVADGIFDRLVRLCEAVPEAAELGLHFCFHDFIDCGYRLPTSLDRFVDVANGVSGLVGRRIDYIHLPVPAGDIGGEYFSPLSRLTMHPETELYLGLVHPSAGLTAARRLVECAARHVDRFGIAAECGLGAFETADIGNILELHAQVAAL